MIVASTIGLCIKVQSHMTLEVVLARALAMNLVHLYI